MGMLEDRVVIVTGAGSGLGRSHAFRMAAEGAKLVVNDAGLKLDGTRDGFENVEAVAQSIRDQGHEVVINTEEVDQWTGAESLVEMAVETYGRLDVLVNNAGILRDRVIVNMSEEEWDRVLSVHMKGTFAPSRHAAAYWRAEAKAGRTVDAALINTTSAAGMIGSPGQSNYSAGKAGIANFTLVCAKELQRYGVRANAIAPYARSRMTLETPGLDKVVAAPTDSGAFDAWNPDNVSPLVAYLASRECRISGGVFHVFGDQVGLYRGWTVEQTVELGRRWEAEDFARELEKLQPENGGALASAGETEVSLNEILRRAAVHSEEAIPGR